MSTSKTTFVHKLTHSIHTQKSSLCCGIDPDPRRIPIQLNWPERRDAAVVEFANGIVDATAEYVCAYKIQRAYFDLLDEPKQALRSAIEHIKKTTDVPIILDAKIGEIDNTMKAYLELCARDLKVDAIVVNPYMGVEVVEPFRASAHCGGVVLVRTSNAGAPLIQDLRLDSGLLLWEFVLKVVCEEWDGGSDIVPILSSTTDLRRSTALAEIPSDTPVFVAGYGAQGGSLDLVRYLRKGAGRPIAVNSSREIIFPNAGAEPHLDWRSAIAGAAKDARDRIGS